MSYGVFGLNFVVFNFVSICLQRVWRIAGRQTMENSVQHATKLLQRLKEAERRAKLLKLEIKDIREQIATLTQSTNVVIAANNGLASSMISFASTSGSNNRNNLNNGTAKRANDQTDNPLNNMDPKRTKHNLKIEDGFVIVFTDGACENNGKVNAKAGIGVWFSDDNPLNISKPVIGRATNNTAEIQATCEALKVIKNLGYGKAKIVTDSQFTIDCMTKWIKNWKKKNWKLASGGPVKNKDDLVVLDNLIAEFVEVKWEYLTALDWTFVIGHLGFLSNILLKFPSPITFYHATQLCKAAKHWKKEDH